MDSKSARLLYRDSIFEVLTGVAGYDYHSFPSW